MGLPMDSEYLILCSDGVLEVDENMYRNSWLVKDFVDNAVNDNTIESNWAMKHTKNEVNEELNDLYNK